MKLRDLEYFCYLYQVGTFTGVANHFHVEQPTVTLAIKRLEASLNAKLAFRNRSKGVIQITPAGEILYRHATSMLRDAELAGLEISKYNSKKIRFGLPPIIGSLYFPLVIDQIIEEHLLDDLEVDENGSQQLLLDLLGGKIDIALLGSPMPIQNTAIQTTMLTSREFVVISSKDHWLANQEQVAFSDLQNERFITLNGKFIHANVLKVYSQQAQFKPHIVFETESISTMKRLVEKNAGIGLLVKDAVSQNDQLSQTTLENPLPERFNISIATRKGYLADDHEQRFIDQLTKLQSQIN